MESGAALLMRALYTLLWWLALPSLPLRLWWRGRREPGYRAHVGERFGRYAAPAPSAEVLWIHAVSLGETRAAAPLIERVLREKPNATLLLTHMTATGRETGRAFAGPRVVQAWLPYDIPFAVRAFLDHFRPRAGLLMETEVWPNLLLEARARGIPMVLVNARLSERSARGYGRFGAFTRRVFATLAGAAAQTDDDAARLRALGVADAVRTGNLKFDLRMPDDVAARAQQLRAQIGAHRPVWIAASTRESEEALILDALRTRALPADTVTIIVPRHPQRFDAVAQLLRERGVAFVRRSAGAPLPPDTDAMLGDTMGELLTYYAAADVAFVGGSLVPLGGQNLLEPIAVGTPTLVGPHTFNFAEATEQAIAAGAARRVANADALVDAVGELLRDGAARERMRTQSRTFFAAHRGAIDRLWQWLAPKLP